MAKTPFISLLIGAFIGVIVAGMFLPAWLAVPLYFTVLYIPPMPILVVVGGIAGLLTNLYVDYLICTTDAGKTREGVYPYPFPNPDPKAVPSASLLAFWAKPTHKGSV